MTESDHRFLKEGELREEAGTPAIVESIRAGTRSIQMLTTISLTFLNPVL